MSFYLLSDSEESWQGTLVYQTMYENYVVFSQQYKNFSMKNWITSDRFIIPKQIIIFVAPLLGKNLPTHESDITSGSLVPHNNCSRVKRKTLQHCPMRQSNFSSSTIAMIVCHYWKTNLQLKMLVTI